MKLIWCYCLFVMIVAFSLLQVHIVNADVSISDIESIRVTEKQAKKSALKIKENVEKIMRKNAAIKADYGYGEDCFKVDKNDTFLKLLAFSDREDDDNKPSGYQVKLLNELSSANYRKEFIRRIERKQEQEQEQEIFHYMSVLKPSEENNHCYKCHHTEAGLDDKFKAIGVVAIAISVK